MNQYDLSIDTWGVDYEVDICSESVSGRMPF